jgi:hypothetical protein
MAIWHIKSGTGAKNVYFIFIFFQNNRYSGTHY